MQATGPGNKSARPAAPRSGAGGDGGSPEQSNVVVCPNCAAVRRDGTWIWGTADVNLPREQCPACERIEANSPAAVVFVRNSMIEQRRDEIFALVRNIESIEMQTRPLERIMKVQDDHFTTTIATSGEHIAQHVASAIAGVTRATITTRAGDDGVTTLVVA